ncbi:MMPL family transporter [Candidatus Fermentibacteria bacterium]|nr:MMPL family transporter [Candidatus Fermentibacteria bacterium]
MRLTGVAVSRPVAVTVLSMVAALLGTVAVLRMPVNLLPSLEYPRLTVETTYPSSSPYEVERLLTDPLEEALAGVRNLRGYTSRSFGDRSRITLEFDWGTRMDFARLEVREKLDVASWSLPDEAGRPTLVEYDPSRRPFMEILLTREGDWTETTDFARRVISTRLEQVDGVAACEIDGEADPAVYVRVRDGAMEELGLDPGVVASALAGANVDMPGGLVRDGQKEFFLSLEGEFESLEDVNKTVIGFRGSTPLLLGDVAEIYLSEKPPTEWASFNGERCLILRIRKMAEANTVEVAADIEELLGEMRREHPGVQLRVIQNDAGFITDSIRGVVEALVLGGLLAFGVLFLFLRDWRSPLILGLSLPLSIALALFILYVLGVTVNIMSLGGLALGIGLLVDNAVVVLEAIYRRREGGEEAAQAARSGTSEVGKAITASTLTTIVVFFPVVYLQGISGQLFGDQALAVGSALLASLLVAITVIPALAARIRRARHSGDVTAGFKGRYERLLRPVLRKKLRVMAVALLLALLAFAGATRLPMQLLPSSPVDQLELSFSAGEGTSMQQLVQLSQRVGEMTVQTGAEWRSARLGVRAEEGVDAVLTASYPSPRTAMGAMPRLRSAWRKSHVFPLAVEKRETLLGEILGGGSGFTLYLEGESIEEDLEAARRLAQSVESTDAAGGADVDYLPGKPEVVLRPNRELLNLVGLEVGGLADYVESLARGLSSTTYYRQDEKVDVMLLTGAGEGIPLEELLRRSMPVGDALIPLKRLLHPHRRQTPGFVEHYQGNRAVSVRVETSSGDMSGVSRRVEGLADSLLAEAPVKVRTGPEIEEMEKAVSDLVLAALLAVGLVYVLLAVQFESFREPFVIMFTVPLGVIGVVAALVLTGSTWNALSGIGLIVLSGIVVNDGILLVERIGQLRRAGTARIEAIVRAGKDRFRPVIMTTATTVLGLLPMAIGFGTGASLRQPLAISIIGGIIVATLLTLVVVPVLYGIITSGDDRR